jgi:hypothetical protein
MDKQSSLLRKSVNYGQKSFIRLPPGEGVPDRLKDEGCRPQDEDGLDDGALQGRRQDRRVVGGGDTRPRLG